MSAISSQKTISDLLQFQRLFFKTGQTHSLEFRLAQLRRLKQVILQFQDEIVTAAKADLGRPAFEAYFEIATLTEINLALKQLRSWAKTQPVTTPLEVFPASAWTQPEPLGVVLIIGPWNYPFQLMISPLVGAIAAGNCAILKPSEFAPHTSAVVARMIQATFEPNYLAVVEGDASISQELLAERFDHIFFTGGAAIGRIVMEAAARHLTPVTLELGGKSPCIVDADVPVEVAAKRIAWGKFINAGQTCIAPDYLLVDKRIKPALIEALKTAIYGFYGENPAASPDYGRLINQRHFNRVAAFLETGNPVIGGEIDSDTRYIAPTVLDNISWDDPIMQEEIFGPILPVLTYENLEQAITWVNARPKPLALYFFSQDQKKQDLVLQHTTSGSVCLNDVVMQFGVFNLPFGGVGQSGMGNYHGKASFDTFSHRKSVLKRSFWLDLGWRYAPYTVKKLNQIKRIITG